MFSARAPASAAGASLISPKSWRWLGPGNVGGRIRSIAVHPKKPETMFAGSVGGGIWKTTNGGAGWTPVDDFMAVLSVSSLVINPANPGVMFAGTGEGYGNADSLRGAGIFKSVDGGTTWTQLPRHGGAVLRGHPPRHFLERHGRCSRAPTRASGAARTASTFTWIDAGVTPQDVDINPSDGRKAVAAGYGADRLFVGRRPHVAALDRAAVDLGPHRARVRPEPARHDLRARRRRRRHALPERQRAARRSAAVSATPLLDNGQGWDDEALWVNPRDSNHVVAGGVFLRQTFDGGSDLAVDQRQHPRRSARDRRRSALRRCREPHGIHRQ